MKLPKPIPFLANGREPVYTEAQMREMYLQGLEDAARECDEVQDIFGRYTFTARVSAERIRALKEKAND